jgi:DNA-directed RNA polymerase subunit N (RpoN/RPB10)
MTQLKALLISSKSESVFNIIYMLVPIRCVSCGMPIAHVYDVFTTLREEKIKKCLKDNNTIHAKASSNLDIKVDCMDIFEILQIHNACCRMHLATVSEFYK